MYGLMDCNNFFVSCERLFRPDLTGVPVAVLSSNDGCIVSRSQEVKDLGIAMGVPYFQVRDVCRAKGITLFSSNFTLYRDISARVMRVLKVLAEDVEIYSVDEAFFRLPESITEKEVVAIRRKVMQRTGIPVSIGVAPSKTLAKYAADRAKKERNGSGVHILDMNAWQSEAKEVSCGSIWGVGQRSAEALRAYDIAMVGDLLAAPTPLLRSILGIGGARLQLELSGIAVLEHSNDDLQHSIMSTRSFAKPVTDRSILLSAIGYHITEVAKELREKDACATRLSIAIRPSRHGAHAGPGSSREILLAQPTANTHVLLSAAQKALWELYVPGTRYKKAGVSVSGIMPRTAVTEALFADDSPARRLGALDGIIDALNARFGHGTVVPGVILGKERWAARAQLCSPRYTTNWREIAVAHAG